MKTIPVLIDTDPAIGLPISDVDDGLAIFLALNSDELEVDGITAVFGNTNVDNTYRIAKEVLSVAKRTDIPVYKGAYNKTWMGVRSRAVQFLIDHIMEHPGEITLVGLGPLTNIATAFYLEPRLAENLKSLLLMGGIFSQMKFPASLIQSDFNFNQDGLATRIVLDQDVDTTLVGIDTTAQVFFSDLHYVALQRAKTPITEYLTKSLKSWLIFQKVVFLGKGFNPHDPITMAVLLNKNLYTFEEASLDVYISKRKAKLPRYAHKRHSNSLPYLIPNMLSKEGKLTVTIPPNDSRKHKFKICRKVNANGFLKLLVKRLSKK